MVVHVCIQVQAHVLIYSPVSKCLDMHGSTLYVGCRCPGSHYISIAIIFDIFINYMYMYFINFVTKEKSYIIPVQDNLHVLTGEIVSGTSLLDI